MQSHKGGFGEHFHEEPGGKGGDDGFAQIYDPGEVVHELAFVEHANECAMEACVEIYSVELISGSAKAVAHCDVFMIMISFNE